MIKVKYRYSDYSLEQLREELGVLKEKVQKAEQLGKLSQVAINERKIQIVSSYMLNPADYKSGAIHELSNDPGHKFKIDYVNGVIAWGHRINLVGEVYEEQEALPIAMLADVVE